MNDNIISNEPVSQSFIPQPIQEENYVMGALAFPTKILMPTGHGWEKYMPTAEAQRRGEIETNCCPAYGTLNAVEALGRLQYGLSFQNNLSERYLSIMSGMNGYGGWPFEVAEIMRKDCGAVPEVFLPFTDKTDSLKKFFSPNPMSYSLFKIGLSWKKKYDFKHGWVFTGGTVAQKQAKMMEALKYSPLGVSGYAWSLHYDGKYYKDGPDIHWFNIFDYVEGEYWLAFDSYAPYVKKLDWNYDFGYAEVYSLTRRLGSEDVSEEPEEARLEYFIYRLKCFFKSKYVWEIIR